MTTNPIPFDGEHLNIDNVVAIARHNAPVALADAARPRIDASRAGVDELIARGAPTAYGINAGFGVFANVPIHADQSARLMRNLILSHSAGVGDPLPERVFLKSVCSQFEHSASAGDVGQDFTRQDGMFIITGQPPIAP